MWPLDPHLHNKISSVQYKLVTAHTVILRLPVPVIQSPVGHNLQALFRHHKGLWFHQFFFGKYPAMDIRPLLLKCHGSEVIFDWSRSFYGSS